MSDGRRQDSPRETASVQARLEAKRRSQKPYKPRRWDFPRLAARLVHMSWPGASGDSLVGDLDEEFHRHVRPHRGALAARYWYWRQALLTCGVALKHRLADRRRRVPAGGTPSPHRERSGHSRRFDGGAFMIGLRQDLRYAVRGLLVGPIVSVVVILTLALGIGSSTAVFSVFHGVLLDPLPYRDPDGLVKFYPDQLFPLGTAAVEFLEDNAQSFELAAWTRSLFPLSGQGAPEDARGAMVFDNHFAVLGVRPSLGRPFQAGDGVAGASPVVILSHELWVRRFGGEPSIVGRTIPIGGTPHEVVGVMGPRYHPMERDWLIWKPARRGPDSQNCR